MKWTENRLAFWSKFRLWSILNTDIPSCRSCKNKKHTLIKHGSIIGGCNYRYGRIKKPIGLYFYTWNNDIKKTTNVSPNPPKKLKTEHYFKEYVCNKYFESPK